jgi:two-component system, LytTR family, response regulator
MPMSKVTCIIIEDEKPAQEVLRSFIGKVEWLGLSGVFGDSIEAMDFIKKNEVDLIFLDIQIPGITGLEFLRILKNAPQVIITTAYSEYAVDAFDLDVRDYLMKPFSFDRFLKAIHRVTPKPDPALLHQFHNVVTEKSFAFFNVNKTMVKVMFDDVLYVESMREYVYFHSATGKVITKSTIGDIEKLLSNGFLRIHRSFIVNLKKIDAFNAEEVIINGVSLPIGVNYKKMVEVTLGAFVNR